jgi:hypothetical protein
MECALNDEGSVEMAESSAEWRRVYADDSEPYTYVSHGDELVDMLDTSFFAKMFLTLFPFAVRRLRLAEEAIYEAGKATDLRGGSVTVKDLV